jgi:molybdate transport system substrate-binding protein
VLRTLALGSCLVALPSASAHAETVRVFAASSLTEAFQEIASLYGTQNPGCDVELNFAGSQILCTQIEEGAPADVFASADRVHMDALEKKWVAGPVAVFARNRLVVVTPRNAPEVRRLADLARPGMRIVVADGNVPVGRYTIQVLGRMDRAGRFGEDFQKRVLANVVSQESNVRAVLAKVSLDEVDAGFVYSTDAQTTSGKTTALQIPDDVNVIVEYPIAILTSTGVRERAAQFVAFVLGPEGQAILVKRGFQPAR